MCCLSGLQAQLIRQWCACFFQPVNGRRRQVSIYIINVHFQKRFSKASQSYSKIVVFEARFLIASQIIGRASTLHALSLIALRLVVAAATALLIPSCPAFSQSVLGLCISLALAVTGNFQCIYKLYIHQLFCRKMLFVNTKIMKIISGLFTFLCVESPAAAELSDNG